MYCDDNLVLYIQFRPDKTNYNYNNSAIFIFYFLMRAIMHSNLGSKILSTKKLTLLLFLASLEVRGCRLVITEI